MVATWTLSVARRFLLGALVASSSLSAISPSHADEPTFRGKLVLFGVSRPEEPSAAIVAMNKDGSGLETLVTLTEPGRSIVTGRISPDARSLAFTIFDQNLKKSEVWVRDANGERRKVCDDGVVRAWSPDGTELACIGGRYGKWKSFVLNVATKDIRPLPIPEEDMVDDWSAGGGEFAIMLGRPDKQIVHPTKGNYPLRQIGLMTPSGREIRLLMDEPEIDHLGPRFSLDGTRVAHYSRVHRDGEPIESSVIRDRDGRNPVTLLSYDRLDEEFHAKPSGRQSWGPGAAACWSSDGKTLAWLVSNSKSSEVSDRAGSNKMRFGVVLTSTKGDVQGWIDLKKLGVEFVMEMDWGR